MRAITVTATFGQPPVKVGDASDGGCSVMVQGPCLVGGADLSTSDSSNGLNVSIQNAYPVPVQGTLEFRMQRGEELWVTGPYPGNFNTPYPTAISILVTEGDLS